MIFDHIGLISRKKREREIWVGTTKVWVTDYKRHPYRVEWLRFASATPVKGPVRTQPHVAYRVSDLKKAGRGLKVLLKPFDVGFAVVGFYESKDGAVIELMKYKKHGS